MFETRESMMDRFVAPAYPLEQETEPLLFIDLRDPRGWSELERALPEGSIDDVMGAEV